MQRLIPLLVAGAMPALLASCPPEAQSGRNEAAPTVQPVEVVATPERPTERLGALFPSALPLDEGPLPAGLANLSAQGCNACHPDAHAGWASSAHAKVSPAFAEAAAQAGTPACYACHAPLQRQHADLASYPEGDIHHPTLTPNPHWDGGLQLEGVTCAACHVREGKIVTANPGVQAPHPTVWSPELKESTACAICHQLSWPGASQPFYDTYGEWERSPHAAAGVSCQSCHFAHGDTVRHDSPADPARAVSLLVRPARPTLARGGPPLAVEITLQNTGAGHAIPTGNPWKGVRLEAAILGPADRKGIAARGDGALVVDLARTVQAEAPWEITADSRLQAGEARVMSAALSLPAKAPPGPWRLEVTLTRTLYGKTVEEPFVRKVIPLTVD